MKIVFSLLALAGLASAACPNWVGRPEVYDLGTVVTYNGANYEVVRALDNGWITPSDTYFWAPTAKVCDGSDAGCSSSGTGDLAQVLANQATIISMLQELKGEHAVIRQDIAKLAGKGQFTDPRDGQVYPYVTIGNQVWMATNMNYAVAGSVCISHSNANCATYGRLYNWATAQTTCPTGWHLPSNVEWNALGAAVGGSATAGLKLKSTKLWNASSTPGTDDFGFSALPGGDYIASMFYRVGTGGYWWLATEHDATLAHIGFMDNQSPELLESYAGTKTFGFSVRCLKD